MEITGVNWGDWSCPCLSSQVESTGTRQETRERPVSAVGPGVAGRLDPTGTRCRWVQEPGVAGGAGVCAFRGPTGPQHQRLDVWGPCTLKSPRSPPRRGPGLLLESPSLVGVSVSLSADGRPGS